MTFNSRCE